MQTFTTKRITWERPDGFVIVTVPCSEPLPGEVEQAYLDRIAMNARSTSAEIGASTRGPDVEASALPPPRVEMVAFVDQSGQSDQYRRRRFRDAWRIAGGAVAEAPALCRQIVLDRVRLERKARLLESDAERARLEDQGTAPQKATLRDYRQALRDLPATVQAQVAGMTPDQLEAYVPPWPVKPF